LLWGEAGRGRARTWRRSVTGEVEQIGGWEILTVHGLLQNIIFFAVLVMDLSHMLAITPPLRYTPSPPNKIPLYKS
jgi:hypothetical protein